MGPDSTALDIITSPHCFYLLIFQVYHSKTKLNPCSNWKFSSPGQEVLVTSEHVVSVVWMLLLGGKLHTQVLRHRTHAEQGAFVLTPYRPCPSLASALNASLLKQRAAGGADCPSFGGGCQAKVQICIRPLEGSTLTPCCTAKLILSGAKAVL